MSPAFNPAMGGIVMDLGYGEVVIDEAFAHAVQAFCQRSHDALLRREDPDRAQARRLRLVSFDLIEAGVEMRASQPCEHPTICELKPLTCQVVKLRPELWGNS